MSFQRRLGDDNADEGIPRPDQGRCSMHDCRKRMIAHPETYVLLSISIAYVRKFLRISLGGLGLFHPHCSPGLLLPVDCLHGDCGGADSTHSHFLLLDRKLNAGLAEPPLNLLM